MHDLIIFCRRVAEYGQQWEKIAHGVGRMSSDCRDRWRNHLQNREIRQTGTEAIIMKNAFVHDVICHRCLDQRGRREINQNCYGNDAATGQECG